MHGVKSGDRKVERNAASHGDGFFRTGCGTFPMPDEVERQIPEDARAHRMVDALVVGHAYQETLGLTKDKGAWE